MSDLSNEQKGGQLISWVDWELFEKNKIFYSRLNLIGRPPKWLEVDWSGSLSTKESINGSDQSTHIVAINLNRGKDEKINNMMRIRF